MVEADLAYRGIDFRDLWRPKSGMTLRRLFVLLKGLPPDSAFKLEMAAAAEVANRPSVEQLRARQAYYKQREGAT